MNEHFVHCSLCGYPHSADEEFCPVTRRPIRKIAADRRPLNPVPKQTKAATPVQASSRSSNPKAPGPRMPPVPSAATHVPVPSRILVADATHQGLLGTTIGGKYEVRSVLGSGGMGSVFEAVHLGIGRHCAVKVLNANQLQKKDAVRRFHHEARAAARIGHPNICEVYDFGTLDDGRPYLVMEKLVGETWADCIAREGGLPFADVIDIMRQVLSGLYAAHENGIIHRDIKPENVFLSKRVGCPPVAKLLDFGVSKVMIHHPQSKDDGDLEMTRTGIVLGTPYYLAPEQARGDRNLDARVDLYACGVMLYEALTGRRPFVAANYNALLIQILTSAPRPIQELRKDIPSDLIRILDKAMARERHQRYPNAIAFQADLQEVELPAPPSRIPPRPAPASRPQPPPAFVPSRAPAPPFAGIPQPQAETHPPLPRAPAKDYGRRPSSETPPVAAFSDKLGKLDRAGRVPAREQLLRALPVASADDTLPRLPSSSSELDAFIEIANLPEADATRRGGRERIAQGFDDQPTEVLTHMHFFDDESTARGVSEAHDGNEATERARPKAAVAVQRASALPPRPQEPPRPRTPMDRRHPAFVDDSKTDVMSPTSSQSTNKPRPNYPGHGRPRRG